MEKKFKCISCTASTNGGFIAKLQAKSVKTASIFGVTKTVEASETYYLKVDGKIPEGTEDVLPLELFNIVERPFILEDTGEEIQLKWLHLK